MAVRPPVILLIHAFNRHHTGPPLTYIGRLTERSEHHPSLGVHLLVSDIRTFYHVVLIIDPHDSVLLVSDLVFVEIGTALALVPGHFEFVDPLRHLYISHISR